MAMFCPNAVAVGTVADWVVAVGTLALFVVATVGPVVARKRAEADMNRRADEMARRALAGRTEELRELHFVLHDRSTAIAYVDHFVKILNPNAVISIMSIPPLRFQSEILDRLPESLAIALGELSYDITLWNNSLQLFHRGGQVQLANWDALLVRANDHLEQIHALMRPFSQNPIDLPDSYPISIPLSDPPRSVRSRPPGMPVAEYKASVS